jgi:ATP-binding protein involved in chromosome partitioning
MPDGSTLELFGSGGGQVVADELSQYSSTVVKLIGKVPISLDLRAGSDSGSPVVLSHTKDPASIEIARIAGLLIDAKLPAGNRTLKVGIA